MTDERIKALVKAHNKDYVELLGTGAEEPATDTPQKRRPRNVNSANATPGQDVPQSRVAAEAAVRTADAQAVFVQYIALERDCTNANAKVCVVESEKESLLREVAKLQARVSKMESAAVNEKRRATNDLDKLGRRHALDIGKLQKTHDKEMKAGQKAGEKR